MISKHDIHPKWLDVRISIFSPLHFMGLLLTGLLIVLLWVSPSVAEDSDYPHNFVQGASCNTGTCHSNYYGGTAPYVTRRGVFYEAGCLYCHDDTDPAGSLPAQTALTHSSATTSTKYGTWTMKCIDCHHEHLQMQYWVYGEESFVFSGISDPGGVTEYTLTMSGAGWDPDCFAGMVLFPNIEDTNADYSNYGIIGNTADTITVKGPMDIYGGSYDPPITDGNKAFAIIYGKGINSTVPDEPTSYPGIPQKDVRFFDNQGPNSFADGDATYDGICEVCHTQTSHHRNDGLAPNQSHNDGSRCTTCHSHANGFAATSLDHEGAGFVLADSSCMECHGGIDTDLIGDVHGGQCGLCHVASGGGGPLVEPLESTLPHGGDCIDCHGTVSDAHDHTATPSNGPVAIFPYADHDFSGGPNFIVNVSCGTCHMNDLMAIHGSNCETCHPTPRDTLTTWDGGCQQGGCHTVFHENSTTAHFPFSDTTDPALDCNLCHDPESWAVPQSSCLNCHATYAGDATPPVTTSNAQSSYQGTAKIDFKIIDNGKVGLGTTFYKLDSGPVTAGSYVLVNSGGVHTVEFWSVDQSGNVEVPTKSTSFDVVLDTTPPTTTSNAQPSYSTSATITLTATDDSTQGVKNTYYSLNSGPTQTGTTVFVSGPSGTSNYTLAFWSEDWSGNIETQNSVSFTISGGNGTIRLVWGNSDSPNFSPSPGDWSRWTIWRGGFYKQVISRGSSAPSTWDGVDDIIVPVHSSPYFVRIDWYWAEDDEPGTTTYGNIYITTPGQIAIRRY
jgi:hypothetical protein